MLNTTDAKITEIHYCPKCGESYYTEMYKESTAVNWSPVYKMGEVVNLDENPNRITVHCKCVTCGEYFTYEEKVKPFIRLS